MPLSNHRIRVTCPVCLGRIDRWERLTSRTRVSQHTARGTFLSHYCRGSGQLCREATDMRAKKLTGATR